MGCHCFKLIVDQIADAIVARLRKRQQPIGNSYTQQYRSEHTPTDSFDTSSRDMTTSLLDDSYDIDRSPTPVVSLSRSTYATYYPTKPNGVPPVAYTPF